MEPLGTTKASAGPKATVTNFHAPLKRVTFALWTVDRRKKDRALTSIMASGFQTDNPVPAAGNIMTVKTHKIVFSKCGNIL